MNLRAIVQDYILRVGNDEAARFFEKNISTIKSWRSTAVIPTDAVEKLLDHLNYTLTPPDQEAPVNQVDEIWNHLNNIHQRLQNLEQRLNPGRAYVEAPLPSNPAEIIADADDTPQDVLTPMAVNIPPSGPPSMISQTVLPTPTSTRPQPAGPPTIPGSPGAWLQPRTASPKR